MAVTTTKTNKPINPRGNDQSPKGYNRAELYTGKALDFDGVNDYVDIGSFSMSGNNATFVFNYNQDAAASAKFVFDNEGARLSIGQGDVSGSFGVDTGSIAWEYFGSLESGKWYGIAVIIEGSTARCYANGVAFGDAVDIGETLNFANVTNATIGARYSKTASNFDGQLSGFKIFNTALTAAQVSDLYNNPEKIVPTGVADSALKLWLPMMEGAGTTAYDGSGNGNHGTISGATWTHGIGAPVAQTAVIDWNKNKNNAAYSEEFSSWGANSFVTITDNAATAPDGQTTADSVAFTASQSNARMQETLAGAYESQTHVVSVWAKVSSGTEQFRLKCTHSGVLDYYSSDLTATTEWQRFSFSQAFGSSTGLGIVYGIYNATDLASRTIQFWGFQLETNTSSVGPYVRTSATAQTSDVLLPQGLTTGRDITGVNLFENVRKQGALNLDGNSWAEVHDNASLDFSSGMTLEAWFQIEANSFGRHVLGKWNFPSNKREYLIYWNGTTNKIECYFGNAGAAQSANVSVTPTGQWVHFVGTTDGSTITPYLNGVAGTTAAQTTALGDSDIDLKIGTDDTNTGAQYRMNTPVAQPRIYNRALTAEEVQRNYNAGKNIYK